MSILAGFIMPHPPIVLKEVGRGEETKMQKTKDACDEIARRIAALAPDTIVVLSPHSVMYADYFHISPGDEATGNLGRFGAAGLTIAAKYDTEFVHVLAEAAGQAGIYAGTLGQEDAALDHGTMIPLCFINAAYTGYRLVRIGVSGLSPLAHYRLGKCITSAAQITGRRVVIIASGDLSHKLREAGPYGFAPEGPEFDRAVTAAMAAGAFDRFLAFGASFCASAGECGLRAFQVMAGTLDGKAIEAELLSYEGPFGVGYAVAAFMPKSESPDRFFAALYEEQQRQELDAIRAGEDAYVRLARLSLETYVKTGQYLSLPDGLPDELLCRRAGVFVSLKKQGLLRGCIGTIAPVTDSIAAEILRNAVAAACEDPRFTLVREQELDELIYSVDVLGVPELVSSEGELDVDLYGVIVTCGSKRGLLLPHLDGVDTAAQQVAIAKQKAGIGANDPCVLERFEVVRHR